MCSNFVVLQCSPEFNHSEEFWIFFVISSGVEFCGTLKVLFRMRGTVEGDLLLSSCEWRI